MNRNMRRVPGISSGPLVTNHIRNLDQELEMLQRRRELLHHEQQMLSNEIYTRKRPFESDQPPHNFEFAPHHSATQNFAHLYDNGSGSGYNFGPPQPLKKRHHINVWDDDRFNINQNTVGPRRGPFAGPNSQRMSPPKPLMSITPRPSIGRRIAGPVPQKNRKDFIPNKVTKAKVKPYDANKINAVALALAKKVPNPPNKILGDQMLLPDKVPSQQVAGRLELALGAIVKQMKEHYCTNEETTITFSSKQIQRAIKQGIRERLRTVMLNKVVGRFIDIVDIYRKTYPTSTDKEILDTAILNADSDHLKPPYFNKVLAKKLKEMFERLQLLSEGKEAEIIKIIESRPSLTEESAEEAKKRYVNAKIFYASLVDALLEERIPRLLPNYTEQIVQLFEQSKETKKDDKDGEDPPKNEEDMTSIKLDNEVPPKNDENMTSINLDTEEECEMENSQITNTDNEKCSNVVDTEDKVVSNNLSDEKNNIETSQINENKEEVVEESVKKEAEEKEIESIAAEVLDDSQADVSVGTPLQRTKPCASSQYFVKVLGQPNLPNRVDAYKFLNKFNAVSIKKHKVIQNLLVVGFNSERDFNDALATSGTVVGNSCIIIKANDKPSQNNSSPSQENNSNREILPLELENQISDLLSSIRKANEDDDDDDDTSNKEETNMTDCSVQLNKTENEIKQDGDAVLDDSEEPKSDDNPEIKKEIVDTSDSKNNLHSPSDLSEKDCRSLETVKEEEDTKELINDSGDAVVESNGDDSVKSNRVKETPSKTTRQNVATPRTIRTRRSSRILQNN